MESRRVPIGRVIKERTDARSITAKFALEEPARHMDAIARGSGVAVQSKRG
jgi:transposase